MSKIIHAIVSGTALKLSLSGTAAAQSTEDYSSTSGMSVFSLAPLVLAGAIVLGGASSTSAAPTDEPGFSMATVTASLMRAAVGYGRIIADIRYGALETDSQRGAMVLRDLQINGIGEQENCKIGLGKLEISGLSFWGAEEMRSRFEASNLSIATNCFGPDAAMIGMVTGGDTIPLETLVIDVHQVAGTGAASLDIEAVSPGIASISGNADFDYITMSMPGLLKELKAEANDPYGLEPTFDENGNLTDPENDVRPDPDVGLRATLRAADLTVENLGLWERMQPLLPPDATSPAALQQMVSAEPGTELRNTQEAMVATLQNFLEQPGRVTVEIRPEQPIAIDTISWKSNEDAVATLKPRFSNALPTPPVALIAGPEGDDPLALGLALANGQGVPQNSRRAIELLSPLEDNAEALLTVARLTAAADLPGAYAHAQKAAALGDQAAPAALDRIEAKLATADLLAAQPAADTAVAEDSFASVPALRNAAIAYAEGKGVPRSYVLARRLAGSAAAAGDGRSEALIASLDRRFGDDPDWIAARDTAADLAMDDWTGQQLATRFAGQ